MPGATWRAVDEFLCEEVESSRQTVYAAMSPTPQYAWPLLRERWACRSGSSTRTTRPPAPSRSAAGSPTSRHCAPAAGLRGVISATRGNHGQSVAGARRAGLARHHRRAARQLRGEECCHARARRDAGRARRRFPGGPRTCRRAGGAAGTADGAFVPSRPGAGRDDVLGGVLREFSARQGARRGVRADRPGFGFHRRGSGAGPYRRLQRTGGRRLGACDLVSRLFPRRPGRSRRR